MNRLRMCAIALGFAALSQPLSAADMTEHALQQWMASAAPVAQHVQLQQMAGRWRIHQRDWRSSQTPWNDATGIATWRPVLGGRFIEQELVTTLGGHPYHGLGLIGFDREAGKYVGAWMDDFGTSLLPLEGSWDAASRTLNLKGYVGPQADPHMQWSMKQIWRDKNHVTVEWWGPSATGAPMKHVEVDYTRV